MDLEEHLVELERRFWTDGPDFYREALADDALMAFPAPVGTLTRDAAIRAVAGAPRWSDVEFRSVQVVFLNEGAAVLTYGANARRDGEGTPYSAVVGSAYVERQGVWKLAFHQQTPEGQE